MAKTNMINREKKRIALTAKFAKKRKALKKDGLLTSDSRVKERKKYGLAGARKRFQFSKR